MGIVRDEEYGFYGVLIDLTVIFVMRYTVKNLVLSGKYRFLGI